MTTDLRRGLQRSEHRLLLLTGDAAAGCVALATALWIWSVTTGFHFDAEFLRKWVAFALLVPIWVALLAPARQMRVGLSLDRTRRALFGASVIVAAAYLLAYFYAPRPILPRLPALYFLWEAMLLTLAWRLCYVYALSRGVLTRSAVVIGDASASERFVELLARQAPDVQVVATIDPTQAGDIAAGGAATRLDHIVRGRRVSEIILAPRISMAAGLAQALVRWQEQGVEVVPMTVEYEQLLKRMPIADLESDWMFTSLPESVRAYDASRTAKRVVDIVGGIAGLLLFVVATPIVAVLVVMDSGRPVFYRQRRLGVGGRVFDIVKFRTMVHGAESDGGPRWAATDDPRVTRAGRWLRRMRLDELPQVLSVLRGEMSLVGPRPERPEIAEQLETQVPFYRARLMVRPGLTGWAQVNASYGDSVEGAALKLEYDLYYIKHRSLMLDAWIMLRTIGTVFAMGGR
jgi:exopolysaccharide biosynthesis polyprenyl glycosylphosphotransferase